MDGTMSSGGDLPVAHPPGARGRLASARGRALALRPEPGQRSRRIRFSFLWLTPAVKLTRSGARCAAEAWPSRAAVTRRDGSHRAGDD